MQRTLDDLVSMPQLKSGQKVNVRLPEDKYFEAQVVGLGSSGILPYYIVECLDGQFPNETYEYKFMSIPVSEIFLID
jgi:hypothetical protein